MDRNTCLRTYNVILPLTFKLFFFNFVLLSNPTWFYNLQERNCIDGILQFGESCVFTRGFFSTVKGTFCEGQCVRCFSPDPCCAAALPGAQRALLPRGTRASKASFSESYSTRPCVCSLCLDDRPWELTIVLLERKKYSNSSAKHCCSVGCFWCSHHGGGMSLSSVPALGSWSISSGRLWQC